MLLAYPYMDYTARFDLYWTVLISFILSQGSKRLARFRHSFIFFFLSFLSKRLLIKWAGEWRAPSEEINLNESTWRIPHSVMKIFCEGLGLIRNGSRFHDQPRFGSRNTICSFRIRWSWRIFDSANNQNAQYDMQGRTWGLRMYNISLLIALCRRPTPQYLIQI